MNAGNLALLWQQFSDRPCKEDDETRWEAFLRLKEATLEVKQRWKPATIMCVMRILVTCRLRDSALTTYLLAKFSPEVLMSMTAGEVGEALWCFSRLDFHNVWSMQLLWTRAIHIVTKTLPVDISRIIWAMGNSRVLFPVLLQALLRQLVTVPLWMILQANEVAQVSWGLARLGQLTVGLLQFLTDRLLHQSDYSTLRAEDIAGLLWASSPVGFHPEWLCDLLKDQIFQKLDSFNGHQCLGMLQSLVAMKYADAELVATIMQHLLQQHGELLNVPSVVLAVHAVQSLGKDTISTALIQDWVLKLTPVWVASSKYLPTLAVALADLGPGASRALSAVLGKAMTRPLVERWSFQDGRDLMMAMAHLPSEGIKREWKNAVAKVLLQKWSECDLDRIQLVDLFWAFGILIPTNRCVMPFLCDFANVLFSQVDRLTSGEATCLIWSMARHRRVHHLLEVLLPLVRCSLHRYSVEMMSVLLASLTHLNVKDDEMLVDAALLLRRLLSPATEMSILVRFLWVYAVCAPCQDMAFVDHVVYCFLDRKVCRLLW
jgi:hypothetical protein